MKLFLDDFSVFSDLKMHLAKFSCVLKNALNLYQFDSRKMHDFGYLGAILGYMVSKARKLFDLKKILTIMNMPTPKTPKDIYVFNGMARSY